MSTLITFAEAIEQWPLAVAIAESNYVFPLIEGVHLIGLSIAVGLLFITDLRLAGVVLKRIPAAQVLHQLRPWVLGGFVVIFITGGLLFAASASTLLGSAIFAWKMLFIALAGLNAAYFEFVIAKRSEVRDGQVVLPQAAKYAAIASLGLWTVVIVCGRLIPYLA